MGLSRVLTLTASWCLAGILMLACGPELTGPRDPALSLSVDRDRVPLGDSVVFFYEATGRSVVRIVLEYGDGAADSVEALGAQSAAGRLSHTYGEVGTFEVSGWAEDAEAGVVRSQITVTVSGDGV